MPDCTTLQPESRWGLRGRCPALGGSSCGPSVSYSSGRSAFVTALDVVHGVHGPSPFGSDCVVYAEACFGGIACGRASGCTIGIDLQCSRRSRGACSAAPAAPTPATKGFQSPFAAQTGRRRGRRGSGPCPPRLLAPGARSGDVHFLLGVRRAARSAPWPALLLELPHGLSLCRGCLWGRWPARLTRRLRVRVKLGRCRPSVPVPSNWWGTRRRRGQHNLPEAASRPPPAAGCCTAGVGEAGSASDLATPASKLERTARLYASAGSVRALELTASLIDAVLAQCCCNRALI